MPALCIKQDNQRSCQPQCMRIWLCAQAVVEGDIKTISLKDYKGGVASCSKESVYCAVRLYMLLALCLRLFL